MKQFSKNPIYRGTSFHAQISPPKIHMFPSQYSENVVFEKTYLISAENKFIEKSKENVPHKSVSFPREKDTPIMFSRASSCESLESFGMQSVLTRAYSSCNRSLATSGSTAACMKRGPWAPRMFWPRGCTMPGAVLPLVCRGARC